MSQPRSRRRDVGTKLISFSSLPLIAAVAPLLVLPAIARLGGEAGWAAIAIGQAVGGFGATAVALGFGVSGPALVAVATEADARRRFRAVLATKLLLLIAIVPVVAVATAFLAPESHRLDAMAMAAATATTGLSVAWYGIGRGDAWMIAIYETLPRVLSAVAALGVVLWTGSLWPYPLFLAAGALIGVLALSRKLTPRGREPKRTRLGDLWRAASPDPRAWAVEVFTSIYVGAPLAVAALMLSVSETSSVASADKLYRYGLFVIVAFATGTQAWILQPGRSRKDHSAVMGVLGIIGLVGLVAMWLVVPPVSAIFFGAEVAADPMTSLAYGVAYLAVACSTAPVRNILVPRGRAGRVLIGTIASAVVGVAAMFFGAYEFGGAGIGVGLAVSEVVMVVVAGSFAVIEWRRMWSRDRAL